MNATMNRLKLYKKVPENGLAIFSGLVLQGGGSPYFGSSSSSQNEYATETEETGGGKTKMKKIVVDIEPLLPLKHGMYYCDNRFHPEALREQLKEVTARTVSGTTKGSVGFVIMNGDGVLIGKLTGTTKTVLGKLKVTLPKKHRNGGQSSVRFERLRKEARNVFVKEAAELVNKLFISDEQPTISSIVYAGFADLKNCLNECSLLDHRIQKLEAQIVDISYGFEPGFEQAIAATTSSLKDMKYIQEKELLNKYMEEIAKGSNKVVYGVRQTMAAVEMGACDKLILYEDLPLLRVKITRKTENKEEYDYLTPAQFQQLVQKSENQQDTFESCLLMEWLVETQHQKIALEIISDSTAEAKQFIQGFGGIAGVLRYELPGEVLAQASSQEIEEEDDLTGFE